MDAYSIASIGIKLVVRLLLLHDRRGLSIVLQGCCSTLREGSA